MRSRWLRPRRYDPWRISRFWNRSCEVRPYKVMCNFRCLQIYKLCINSGVLCVVSANVATMAGGAMNETSALKGGRLHQIAIQNKLPTVTFVQSVNTKLITCFNDFLKQTHFLP